MDWQDRIKLKWLEKATEQVNLAKDDVIRTLTSMWMKGELHNKTTSPYSERHAKRRKKKGLQTSKKDFYYGGYLQKALIVLSREYSINRVEVEVGFDSNTHPLEDYQSDSTKRITNAKLAKGLGDYEKSNLLKLKEADRNRIQQKYGVRIRYD